jgi:hypothetical protein
MDLILLANLDVVSGHFPILENLDLLLASKYSSFLFSLGTRCTLMNSLPLFIYHILSARLTTLLDSFVQLLLKQYIDPSSTTIISKLSYV